ncbi:CCT-beta [Caerostris extrusa]|uniref:CCT-beta n=1 Tax=Caerostris extrusa TaxID=172846 RepID=A0AAV4PLQ1_CAEEX|nr:CCT-beta [Caerostris extrusa]
MHSYYNFDNGGYDSAQLVTELRSAHAEGKVTTVVLVNMTEGRIDDMMKLESLSLKVKSQVINGATEMILRVDGIIKAAPRQRSPDDRHC